MEPEHLPLTPRQAARRFWERGRVVYNAAILLVCWLEYSTRAGGSSRDTPAITQPQVLGMFFTFAVGANLCYTLVYGAERTLASRSAAQRARVRFALFIVGTLVGVAAAYAVGVAVASLQYPDR